MIAVTVTVVTVVVAVTGMTMIAVTVTVVTVTVTVTGMTMIAVTVTVVTVAAVAVTGRISCSIQHNIKTRILTPYFTNMIHHADHVRTS